MIRALVDFALNNKFVVLAIAILLAGWGAISFHNLPVEAYPDIADNYVTIITQWAGRSAEEVEQQVTIPIEIQMAGMPHMTFLRSESILGLSFVIMIFDDSSVNDWNRQKVLERLTQANLPADRTFSPKSERTGAPPARSIGTRCGHQSPVRPDGVEVPGGLGASQAIQIRSQRGRRSDFGGTEREYQVPRGPEQAGCRMD